MQVIGLSGYARTGKDTVARILVDEYSFTRIGFADPLYELMLRLDPYATSAGTRLSTVVATYGWERAKDTFPEVRRLLQQHATPARELIGDDIWIRAAFRKMEPDGRYVITDMRFPNEMRAVREVGGLTVRVHRPGYGPANGHISETALDGERFAYEMWNAGTAADLRDDVADLVRFMEGVD
jgi:hypothetical protein